MNFNLRAQVTLALARKEADRMHHGYCGSEHLLLGVINLGQGPIVKALETLKLDIYRARAAAESVISLGKVKEPLKEIPYTPRVKVCLARAGKEAEKLGHEFIGAEHILLGIIVDNSGSAAKVVKKLNIDPDEFRFALLEVMQADGFKKEYMDIDLQKGEDQPVEDSKS